jgi:hypothetical protein
VSRADIARAALQEKRGPTGKENRSNESHPQTAHLVQVRRRREASYRLPEYTDGLRDPLDGLVLDRRCDRRSARLAWWHLRAEGLMSEYVEDLLRRWSA